MFNSLWCMFNEVIVAGSKFFPTLKEAFYSSQSHTPLSLVPCFSPFQLYSGDSIPKHPHSTDAPVSRSSGESLPAIRDTHIYTLSGNCMVIQCDLQCWSHWCDALPSITPGISYSVGACVPWASQWCSYISWLRYHQSNRSAPCSDMSPDDVAMHVQHSIIT